MAQTEWKAWAIRLRNGDLWRKSNRPAPELFSERSSEDMLGEGESWVRVTVSIDPDQGEKP